MFLSDVDQTDPDHGTYCVRSQGVVDAVKGAYYAAKLLKLLRGAPVPPPP